MFTTPRCSPRASPLAEEIDGRWPRGDASHFRAISPATLYFYDFSLLRDDNSFHLLRRLIYHVPAVAIFASGSEMAIDI